MLFDEATHTYTNELGCVLISTTQLLSKHHLAPDYSAVKGEVLKKASEYGKLVHKELETYVKEHTIGISDEVRQFSQYINDNKLTPVASELVVYNDIVAGTIDLIYVDEKGELYIADHKTTSAKHKEAISWQLSVYAYLYNGMKVKGGKVFHYHNGLKVCDIELKPINEVARLLQCEREGKIYNQELVGYNAELRQLQDIEQYLYETEKQITQAKAKADEIKRALMIVMEENGIKKYKSDKITLTYVDRYDKVSYDYRKLFADHTEIKKEYYALKTSVKPTLKITLKENE